MTKHDRKIMEILEAFDLTGSIRAAGRLAGADPHTVARYVALRDAGNNPFVHTTRTSILDQLLEKIEELVERSMGDIRADVVHRLHLVPMGFSGDERTTRRAVAAAKERYRQGHRRTYRPWIPEPGQWAQFDWGKGPDVAGRETSLFCAWLAWSRYRVVMPTWDKTLPTLLACIDTMLRRFGAAPTYLLTDNERTVSVDHVAGLAVRHPHLVAAGRHYGVKVETCVPYDPETKACATDCTSRSVDREHVVSRHLGGQGRVRTRTHPAARRRAAYAPVRQLTPQYLRRCPCPTRSDMGLPHRAQGIMVLGCGGA